jgi:hypothetical protein
MVSSKVDAEQWTPEVIFHDPLSSNGKDQATQERHQRKPNTLPRKPKYPKKPGNRPSTRAEAIEAVSRDLAILALRASVI